MTAMEPQSPPARRLRPPSWLDLRLVIGVLMVLVAILVGARVVASSDKSTKVWALARDVASGTQLTSSDLQQDRVRLYSDASRYLAVSTSPIGRTVNRELRSGDLLPGSALTAAPAGIVLPLAVDVDNVPPDIAHGDRIDVYVIPGSSDTTGRTEQVLRGAVVQSVTGIGGDGLAADNSKAQITVTIAGGQEDQVVKRLATGTLYVVQRVGSAGDDSPPPSPSPSATSPSPSPTATPSR